MLRRLYSTTFRQDLLEKVRTMPVFASLQLQDAVVAACKAKDMEVATELLGIAADAKEDVSELAAYATNETDPAGALRILELMSAKKATVPPHAVQRTFERICYSASPALMDRFLCLTNTQPHLESAILFVYLRGLHLSRLIEILQQAQQRRLSLHVSVWQEIFEVLLQSGIGERKTLTEVVARKTDRRFAKLAAFLGRLQVAKVKLDANAVEALQTVMSTSVIPASFLRYLDTYNRPAAQTTL
ncbi:hypothetical protein PSACC_01480 [Paramicrosporidium saccamoebae]|uniref:Uncharacterized protein n=1 Tax=Paramicrosporidium saccamoebae TaxID=1246581 RepID=A0A2H9TM34_9FUNG|nr:hypothetical protein PSACC_01480 [Paramicrosporidium saccamoebae]